MDHAESSCGGVGEAGGVQKQLEGAEVVPGDLLAGVIHGRAGKQWDWEWGGGLGVACPAHLYPPPPEALPCRRLHRNPKGSGVWASSHRTLKIVISIFADHSPP